MLIIIGLREKSLSGLEWNILPLYQELRGQLLTGSFSNDYDEGNGNVKKAIGLITITTSLQVHYTFWYTSLPSLHD